MEITKAEAMSIAICMNIAHDEARLCASQIELLIRVAKFAEMHEAFITSLERSHKFEVEYEAALAEDDEKNEAAWQAKIDEYEF